MLSVTESVTETYFTLRDDIRSIQETIERPESVRISDLFSLFLLQNFLLSLFVSGTVFTQRSLEIAENVSVSLQEHLVGVLSSPTAVSSPLLQLLMKRVVKRQSLNSRPNGINVIFGLNSGGKTRFYFWFIFLVKSVFNYGFGKD